MALGKALNCTGLRSFTPTMGQSDLSQAHSEDSLGYTKLALRKGEWVAAIISGLDVTVVLGPGALTSHLRAGSMRRLGSVHQEQEDTCWSPADS